MDSPKKHPGDNISVNTSASEPGHSYPHQHKRNFLRPTLQQHISLNFDSFPLQHEVKALHHLLYPALPRGAGFLFQLFGRGENGSPLRGGTVADMGKMASEAFATFDNLIVKPNNRSKASYGC